jgi:hypothetical protein
MRRTQVLALALILLSPALIGATPTPTSTPTKTIEPPREVVVNLPEGQKPELMEWRPPTVDEMKVGKYSSTEGLDEQFTKIIVDGMRNQGITVSSVDYMAVGKGENNTYRWVALVRNEKGEAILPKNVQGDWMEWPNYFTLNPDKSYSVATQVNGEPITYTPVKGSERSLFVYEGDQKTGQVLPVLAKQAVPTTDKGSVFSQYFTRLKTGTEWKMMGGLGKITTLPDREKTLESALKNGWEWDVVDGQEKWLQGIVRNEKGEIPLEDGITIKLKQIKLVQGGKVDFTEKDGANPFPKSNFALKALPSGYVWEELVFEGFNAPDNSLEPYGPTETMEYFLEEDGKGEFLPRAMYAESSSGDILPRIIFFIPHKISNKVTSIRLSKLSYSPLHVIYSVNDPVTSGIQPK